MGKLKILAEGDSVSAQSNNRGFLFETLMAEVLNNCGYNIPNKPRINYSGHEIDIEGLSKVGKNKIYAECKCYDKDIDAPKFNAFVGKFVIKQRKNPGCLGLFIAIPGVNSYVRGEYIENFQDNRDIPIIIYEEEDVIEKIRQSNLIVPIESIHNSIDENKYGVGDWNVLYSNKGFFITQLVIKQGSGIPSALMIFDSKGHLITDPETIDYLSSLDSEIKNYETIKSSQSDQEPKVDQDETHEEQDQIVEVVGSSSCFEYQYPSAPQYFVGRKNEIIEIEKFFEDVLAKGVNPRGLLLEANSGWGKSSLALSLCDGLNNRGHFGIVIDCRTASSSKFVLKIIEYSLRKIQSSPLGIHQLQDPLILTGFEGGVNQLLTIASELEKSGVLLVIILDQFENIIFKPDILKRVRDLFAKITDAKSNIILGFSWKTELLVPENEFPHKINAYLKKESFRIVLHKFSDEDTQQILSQLESEFRPKRKLSKDLRFLLADFPQGYPWALKKICAHVKKQIKRGLSQAEIVTRSLNIKDLFEDDIEDLTEYELAVLHRIAKIAPISFQDLIGEDFNSDIIQNLLDARLLVKVGTLKYDIYWDIFRDYLNNGTLPIQDNYLLRTSPGSVVRAISVLNENSGCMSVDSFILKIGKTKKSYYNVARDIRLLGLAQVDINKITLIAPLPNNPLEFNNALISIVREKIQYNRFVKQILEELKTKGSLSLLEVSEIIQQLSPYVNARRQTKELYGRYFLKWLDYANLASFKYNQFLHPISEKGSGKFKVVSPGKRSGVAGVLFPSVQVKPLQEVATWLVAISKEGIVQTNVLVNPNITRSTLKKCLVTLEYLGFIERNPEMIKVKPELIRFVDEKEQRPKIFAERAMRYETYKKFIEILESNKKNQRLDELADIVGDIFELRLSRETVLWNVKILINWAKYTNIIPNLPLQKSKSTRRHSKSQSKLPPEFF